MASKFASKVFTKIKGDQAEVLAGKIEIKSKSALDGQLAALEASKVEAEMAVGDAGALLEAAQYPSQLLNSKEYIDGIKYAQSAVDRAQDALNAIEESIEYYDELQTELFGA